MSRELNTGAYLFLENSSVSGSTEYWSWGGGRGNFEVGAGGFGGATVALERRSVDPGKEIEVGTNTTLTVDGHGNFELPPCELRVTVTGGPPTGLYAQVRQIPHSK